MVETLLLHFRNVCAILSSKPKVYAMCFSQPKGQAFMKRLASFAVGTLQDALRAHTTDDVKVSVVQCLKALASVNATVSGDCADTHLTACAVPPCTPVTTDRCALVSTVLSSRPPCSRVSL